MGIRPEGGELVVSKVRGRCGFGQIQKRGSGSGRGVRVDVNKELNLL